MPAYVQFQIKLGFGETIVADGPCEVMKLQGRTVRVKHPPHVNVTIVPRAKKRLESAAVGKKFAGQRLTARLKPHEAPSRAPRERQRLQPVCAAVPPCLPRF